MVRSTSGPPAKRFRGRSRSRYRSPPPERRPPTCPYGPWPPTPYPPRLQASPDRGCRPRRNRDRRLPDPRFLPGHRLPVRVSPEFKPRFNREARPRWVDCRPPPRRPRLRHRRTGRFRLDFKPTKPIPRQPGPRPRRSHPPPRRRFSRAPATLPAPHLLRPVSRGPHPVLNPHRRRPRHRRHRPLGPATDGCRVRDHRRRHRFLRSPKAL